MSDGASGSGGVPRRPVALVILDGWGLAPDGPGNAVALAHTPTFDALWRNHPTGTLLASGLAVGLPEGQIGNSEVGHLNLGAGRVVYQDLTRIDRAVEDGSFANDPVLQAAIASAREGGGTFHVVGLVSRGGVHSHVDHLEAAVRAAAAGGAARILVHAITDGRDVAPDASLVDIPAFEARLAAIAAEHGCEARVATVIGRYWAMDRDRRWDRTQRAFDALTSRLGTAVPSASFAVEASQSQGVTDEFVEPSTVAAPQQSGTAGGEGSDALQDGDVVLFGNFRPDRMRQLVTALTSESFDGFERTAAPRLEAVCMTEYEHGLGLPVIFRSDDVEDTLADVLEREGIGQLHVAETEKYAHVTYFFNGGLESSHDGEVRALVDSPRDVATYDLKPQMSAAGVADAFVDGIGDPAVGFAVVNFANPDMVGHTGVLPAAIAACEEADRQLARVVEAVHARGGVCIVTADHGNAEVMLTAEGKPHTAHTTNPVPLVITLEQDSWSLRQGGRLGDVAPTVLELLGLSQPAAMTGTSLVRSERVSA